jgi:hypothetical protein
MRILFPAILLLTCVALVAPSARSDEPTKAPALPPPKTVTLDGSMKVKDALKALTKQTGIALEDVRSEEGEPITLQFKNAPFFQVLDKIAADSGANVDFYSTDGKIRLAERVGKPRLKGPQSVSYDGRFRTALKRVTGSINPETGETTYTGVIEVAWEPTLQPYFFRTRIDNFVVKDDKMNAVKVPNAGGEQKFVYNLHAWQFDTALPALPRESKTIGLVEGQLSFIAPSDRLTFAFGGLNKVQNGTNSKQNNVAGQIDKVTLADKLWTVKASLTYPQGNAKLDDTHSAYEWAKTIELVLTSKDGKKTVAALPEFVETATATRVVATYYFKPNEGAGLGNPNDWDVSLRAPSLLVEVPVKFSFKDVPLP